MWKAPNKCFLSLTCKEILDRLERIDHKEYSGGFEFADSSTFNEMARCFEERKKLADYITNLQQENERLKEDLKGQENLTISYCKSLEDYKSRCEKADNQLHIIMEIMKEQPIRIDEDDEWLENSLIGVRNILQNGSDKE